MIFEISYAIFTVAKSILGQRFVTVCGDSTGLDIDKYALTMIVSTSETPRIDFPMYTEKLIFWSKKSIFEISEAIFAICTGPKLQKSSCTVTSEVKQTFFRLQIKNALPKSCRKCSGDTFNMLQHVLWTKIEASITF